MRESQRERAGKRREGGKGSEGREGGRERRQGILVAVVEGGGGERISTPMLIGDGTSVLMYVFLVCCAPRLPPPLFTGPLARPDLCHHPPYKHFPLRHSPSGKRGRATAKHGERERQRKRGRKEKRERLSSSQPTNQPTHANTQRSLVECCPIAKQPPRKCPLDGKSSILPG